MSSPCSPSIPLYTLLLHIPPHTSLSTNGSTGVNQGRTSLTSPLPPSPLAVPSMEPPPQTPMTHVVNPPTAPLTHRLRSHTTMTYRPSYAQNALAGYGAKPPLLISLGDVLIAVHRAMQKCNTHEKAISHAFNRQCNAVMVAYGR